MTRYDVMTGRSYTDRNGDQKTAWTKIGTLWPLRDREGFSLTFDALPIPSTNKDGAIECRAVCFPPKEKDEQPAQRSNGGGYGDRRDPRKPPPPDLDDSIPF